MKNIATPFSGHTSTPADAHPRRATSPAPSPRAHTLRWRALFASAALLLSSHLPAHAASKAPHCADGYFEIDGTALLRDAAAPDALLLGSGTAGTASGCPATTPKAFRNTHAGDKLVVVWPACGSQKRVQVRATIARDCSTLAGIVKASGATPRRFTAHATFPLDVPRPWDPNVSSLPPDAEIVSPADFLALSNEPGFRIVTPSTPSDDETAAAATEADDLATIEAFVAQHPERADLLSTGIDPNDPDVAPTGDGNYAVTLHLPDGDMQVVTMGPRSQRATIADAIRSFPTRDNQIAIYTQRYAIASQTLAMALPAPADLGDMTTEEITALNAQVAQSYPESEAGAPVPGESLPDSYPSRCSNEIGAGDDTDGSTYCRHSSDGLWNIASWPLKYYDTCVKQQGGRGSCVGFAVTAGREMRVALKYDRWVNLSEQNLYYMAKSTYQPKLYGDGLNDSLLLQQLLDNSYQQPLEKTWDYNPSWSRTANNTTSTYTNSCTNYAGDESTYCSDTAGQGHPICVGFGGTFACAFVGTPTSGITVKSIEQPAQLWDASNPSDSLNNVLYDVHVSKIPVVVSFPTVQSFDAVDKDGFVAYDANKTKVCGTKPDGTTCDLKADCQCSRGGHTVLAVGYVKNVDLPEGAPKGAGGGYVVIKNSWGCAGDAGYFYLPIDWTKAFFNSARAVGDVETSSQLPDQPIDDFHFDYTPVPPNIHIVQPLTGESYVEGQQVPLVANGADFQFDKYALLGTTVWTSSRQGQIGTGINAITTLVQGTHTITVTYTGKLGTTVSAQSTIVVGARPVDLPPTPAFSSLTIGSGAQCPVACPWNCVLTRGWGNDPEDGLLNEDNQVRWYMQYPGGSRSLVATGGTYGHVIFGQARPPKFLGCIRPCGGTFTFTVEVTDSAGNRAEARRTLDTAGCIN